jgi:hypothetical protein
VLALATAAVLCGNTSIEDITAWIAAAQLKHDTDLLLAILSLQNDG